VKWKHEKCHGPNSACPIPDASLAHPMTKRRKPGQLKARELHSLLYEFQTTFGCATPQRESCEQQVGLLDEFERIHAAWAEEQISKAEGFNILRTMRVTRKELCHSDILAWLLDHRLDRFGTHAQGNKGFQLFLQKLNLPQKFAETDYRVTREASGDDSRLDILIEAERRFVIGVENKVASEEMLALNNGKAQTRREWDDLKRRGKELGVPTSGIKAFFLTPDNQAPRSRNFTAISWRLVADVFEEFAAQAKPPMVQLFAQHYAETLRRDIVSEAQTEEEYNE
jgi:hypothetical protein